MTDKIKMRVKNIRKNFESTDSFPGLSFKDKSLAHQSFMDECDINNIMKKYAQTGELPGLIKAQPQYGDFSDMETYQESLNKVILAQEQFAALPARVRERFQNDPAKFLQFATDPKNGKEMVSLGLAIERPKTDSSSSESNAVHKAQDGKPSEAVAQPSKP